MKLFSDLFVNMMTGQNLLESSDCQFKRPNQSYAIFTTPRSGSTFLCELLKSTNIAGFPDEHLREESEVLTRNAGFDAVKYLEKLMTHVVTDNGVFGTKFISHFLQGHQRSGFDVEQVFTQYIPKIIFLRREDKLAQVASIFIAQTTQIWHSYQIKDRQKYEDKLGKIEVENISLDRLNLLHKGILEGESYLESLIKKYRIEACYITYEQLLEDQEIYFTKILDYLELEQPATLNLTARTKKLRSPLTQKIIDRYLEKYNTSGEKKWD